MTPGGRFEVRSHARPWGRRWTWVLRARNGEVVAVSEPYNSERACIDGIAIVRTVASTATGPDEPAPAE